MLQKVSGAPGRGGVTYGPVPTLPARTSNWSVPVITMRASDFSCLSDTNLMMALLTKGQRPALLVNCRGRGADAVAKSMLTWCSAPVHLVRLPGPLDLPLAKHGTVVLADASALTHRAADRAARLAECPPRRCSDCLDYVTADLAVGGGGQVPRGPLLPLERGDAGSERYAHVITSCSATGSHRPGLPHPRRGSRMDPRS